MDSVGHGFRVVHTLKDGRAGLVAAVERLDYATGLAQALCATYGGTVDILDLDRAGQPARLDDVLAQMRYGAPQEI